MRSTDVELLVIRTDPVQEIPAEPGTLDLLLDTLRPKAVGPSPAPEFLDTVRTCGWPLVYDDTIQPGYVHCRPSRPGVVVLDAGEIADYFRRLKEH